MKTTDKEEHVLRRFSGRAFVLASAALVLAATGFNVAGPSGGSTRSTPPAAATQLQSARRVSARVIPVGARRVIGLASSPRFARIYAGRIVQQKKVVAIYVTRLGKRELAAALSRATKRRSAYRLLAVSHSLADLDRLTQAITHDEAEIASHGIHMVMWGPDIASNTVDVLITSYTAAQAQWLEDRYGGPSWITVEPSATPPMGQLD